MGGISKGAGIAGEVDDSLGLSHAAGMDDWGWLQNLKGEKTDLMRVVRGSKLLIDDNKEDKIIGSIDVGDGGSRMTWIPNSK